MAGEHITPKVAAEYNTALQAYLEAHPVQDNTRTYWRSSYSRYSWYDDDYSSEPIISTGAESDTSPLLNVPRLIGGRVHYLDIPYHRDN